ncbi:hypothetical protein [Algoriphagus resistens]|uniref:hypothetical protein n=1 Tax=Algoriphagus resistens TaxID=1750590 RepID=UPI000716C481|nr:hypothetical protein [Algoriphagus resistens]
MTNNNITLSLTDKDGFKDSLIIEQVRPTYPRLANDNYGSPKKIEKWGFVIIAVNKEFTNTRQAEIEAFFNTIAQ